jgi:hypothetical protein
MTARFSGKFESVFVRCGASEMRMAFRLAEIMATQLFLFFLSRCPLIDAVVASGIASRQIRQRSPGRT